VVDWGLMYPLGGSMAPIYPGIGTHDLSHVAEE
jgi:hypothetical protein